MSARVPADSRLEIKFVGHVFDLDVMMRWLRLHPAGFLPAHPDRCINNVYFDTFDYGAFAENLLGASERTKVRYRWYGESRMPADGRLEVKCKRNFFGWKISYGVHRLQYPEGAAWGVIRRAILDQLPPDARRWLDENPAPVILNRYRRRYFVASERDVRVTVDTDQAVWDQRYCAQPSLTLGASMPPTVVVEFKFARSARERASAYLRGIPMRVGRHSKYINGVRAITAY